MTDPPDNDEVRGASQLVVIGASAGGVDALLTLVATLPTDLPAPIVIAQHLDPRRQSHLGELLASRSTLPVRTVNAEEPLLSGVVYVVASDLDVEITDHAVSVKTDSSPLPKPSIDRLLTTASRVFTDDLIAIILTGTGSDGAAGAQAVKALGGTVIVQNPETATFPGMPLAVPPSAIDVVADLDAIGRLLGDLLSGDYHVPTGSDDAELRSFLDRVRERSGLDFSAYKRPTIVRRLQRRMAAVGSESLGDYRRFVERHPEELHRLVGSFLIKVTEFFRDPELFVHLRDEILPALIAEAKERGELRIWSAGCATGEEAYTLAMLVADLLPADRGGLNVRIFATDIATDAVEFARRGVYPRSALESLPADLIERHFTELDGVYEVRKDVRALVVFGEHDLGYRAPFPRIDLVLCRNVLIYFTPELQRRALQLFAFSLRRGGYLILGKAETVSPLPEFFALEQPRLKIFRRVGEAAPIPPDRILDVTPLATQLTRPGRRVQAGRRLMAQPIGEQMREPSGGQQAARLIDQLMFGIVTVDRSYHIRSINLAGRGLLGIHTSAVGEDLIHRTQPSLAAPLRGAIDAALGGESTTLSLHLQDPVTTDDGRDLLIIVSPVSADAEIPDEVVLQIADVSDQARRQREATEAHERLQDIAGRQTERAERAAAEVTDLRRANQRMAVEAAKLRSENEELLVTNEEAQAAAEEIETLNEELQATNEELETLNEELQATVEELTTTNDELQARTAESLSLAAAREADRQQLASTLSAMSDAVLVVAANGQHVMSNAAYDRLVAELDGLTPQDDSGAPLPEEEWPQRRAARGESFTMPFTLRSGESQRRWFEASGQPLFIENAVQGGVIVIRDVTDRSMRRMQEEFLAVAGHELRTPLTALSLSLDLIARRAATLGDTRLEQNAARALDQARRLSALTAEIIDVVKLQNTQIPLHREHVDLTRLARGVVDTAQTIAGDQPIALHASDESVQVHADPRRIEQVLLNLLVNAITFAHGGDPIDVILRADGRVAELRVHDNGPGIPAEVMPHIFERFYQVDADRAAGEGLGLGLFIAREIVTAHGGSIEAQSVPGEGATFIFTLPMVNEPSSVSDNSTTEGKS